MAKTNKKEKQRFFRHKRIRKIVSGTSDQPRLCVHRSLKNLEAQVIDDTQGIVLLSLTTSSKNLQSKIKFGGNMIAATALISKTQDV